MAQRSVEFVQPPAATAEGRLVCPHFNVVEGEALSAQKWIKN
jgi:hypothetical protein